jgi:hypothetical protein
MTEKQSSTPVLTKVSKEKSQRTEDILSQIGKRIENKNPIIKFDAPQIVPVRVVKSPKSAPLAPVSTYFVAPQPNHFGTTPEYKPQICSFSIPETEPKPKSFSSKKQRKTINFRQKLTVSAIIGVMCLMAGLGAVGLKNYFLPNIANSSDAQVLGVTEDKPDLEYKNWIESKNYTVFSPKGEDLDKDELTNDEEYILGTSPISANSCSQTVTDIQNLLNLVDPQTCKPMDLNNQNEFEKYNKVVNIDEIQQKLIADLDNTAPATPEIDKNSLLSIFGVTNLNQIDDISVVNLEKESEQKATKITYLKLIDRVDLYISKNRSYEPFDRDYETPVKGAKYLEVSLKYDIPVKYLLAIARAESRFGTDRYTQSGNLTRPGEHSNIFSLGLTDSGSNVTFESWDKGIESMGKWWQKFDKRGVSVPRRLKIFNPNGDYPTKIEGLADQIETFITAN